jgi:hypothetical protein
MPETQRERKEVSESSITTQVANRWLDRFTTPDNLTLASRALRIGHVLNTLLGGAAVATGHPYLVPVFVGFSGVFEKVANKIDIKAGEKIGSDSSFEKDHIFGGYKKINKNE